MPTVYNICIGIGLTFPILSLLLGGLDSALGVVDIDIDGDGDAGVLPFNFTCLMFSLVLFGCTGKVLLLCGITIVGMLIALIPSVLGYYIIYKFIVIPLKRNRSFASNVDDMLLQDGTVETKIPKDGIGKVSLKDATGCKITYLAKLSESKDSEIESIDVGEKIKVVDRIDNVLLVSRII